MTDSVTIEIDGQTLSAPKGAMLIEVADKAGIHIPRFCYHKKLSIAANCRMCLVEVERAPKPLPACATPIMDGMKVSTKSKVAVEAQQGTMEFLLINHPLDCPICDQGGECELQDVAVGYGSDVSRYTETKRVVVDENLGALVATDMTRCIHCTRCVRFGQEIAGIRELGATGRGEHTRIGTYIEHSLTSEMSGNIIDLCPVGALTSKLFRFTARAWELDQYASVAPHDAVGSNVYVHTRRNQVMRVVPRENEAINECWLSDRDRFSYQGIYHQDRLEQAQIKTEDQWQVVDWNTALNAVVDGLKQYLGRDLGILVSPQATVEEMFLIRRLAQAWQCENVDHRLRQCDFEDQHFAPKFPWLGQTISDLQSLEATLVIASNIRYEQPILAHRLRQSVLSGGELFFVNPVEFEFLFENKEQSIIASPDDMMNVLVGIIQALYRLKQETVPNSISMLVLKSGQYDKSYEAIAKALLEKQNASVFLGSLAVSLPNFSRLRLLAHEIAKLAACRFGYLAEAVNTVGAWMTGMLPHRGVNKNGLNAKEMLEQPRKAYVLVSIEPDKDCFDPVLMQQALSEADFVVALSSYHNQALEAVADIILPIGLFTETSGSYVNMEGNWQSFSGVVVPVGEARPAWKILRVLGNLFDIENFEYLSTAEILADCQQTIGDVTADNTLELSLDALKIQKEQVPLRRLGEVPIYAVDALVRHAEGLQQQAKFMATDCVKISRKLANKLGLVEGEKVLVTQGQQQLESTLKISERIPDNCVCLASATDVTSYLGAAFGEIELAKVE